jgi:hypothetical protein
MGYMLTNGGESGGIVDKPWNYPIIIEHNEKVDRVYIEVDRKHRTIKPRFEQPNTRNNTDTKITITLPAISDKEYKRLKTFCYQYTFLNTHISYEIFFDGEHITTLQALHPIAEHYDNPNSAYCYSTTELSDFFGDIYGWKWFQRD